MPKEPTRPLCWQCGYDVGGVPGDVCPECGADTSRRPRQHLVRHGTASFMLMLGGLASGAILLVPLLHRSVPHGGRLVMGPTEWTQALITLAMLGAGVTLLLWAPDGFDERRLERWAIVAAIVAGGVSLILAF